MPEIQITTPEAARKARRIVARCFEKAGKVRLDARFSLADFATALRERGLDGHWEGSLASWMWQVDGEPAFWVSVPRGSRSGRWHASKDWFK